MVKTEIIYDNTDITANNKQIEILKKHFPSCFDKNGDFVPHKMAEIVGKSELELSKESYSLNWLGKSYARLLANENPLTLLAEDKEHNNKEENKNSQNILIKGDNLEVLKHLKNAYSEKIKMIYIDPPYNTGSDGFVYEDDRKFTIEELSKLAGVGLEEAKRILDFTKSKSNSHSAWLTFMYPRLYVARELLRDDGVIFISIDDNEVAQLKMLCDEVFGEENFIAELTWEKKKKGTFLSNSLTNIKESIVVYSRIKQKFNGLIGEINSEVETYPCINASNNRELRIIRKGIKSKFKQSTYFLPKGSEISDTTMSIVLHSDLKIENNVLVEDVVMEGNWRYTQDNMDMYTKEENLYITQDLYIRRIVKDARNKTLKDLLLRQGTNQSLNYDYFNINNLFEDGWGSNADAEEELRLLFGEKDLFSNPKPKKLIKKLVASIRDEQGIILDFFAGSGTTAHAVMELNASDRGERKFITVQLPELIDQNKNPTAYYFVKNELKINEPTIFDITKARIEKAATKIKKEKPEFAGDLGFKIFESIPMFEGYLDNIEELRDEQEIFDGSLLNTTDLEHLLTTWKVYDGIELTVELSAVKLGGYEAYYHDKILYFVNKGFNTEALKAFAAKLDDDNSFSPSKLVVFGYNFDSKSQRELKEALANYKNKKAIELDAIVRY